MTATADRIRTTTADADDADTVAIEIPPQVRRRPSPATAAPQPRRQNRTASPVPAAPQVAPAAHTPRNGFGITALCLGLVSLVFMIMPMTGFIAVILGGLALIFGLLGWTRANRGQASNKKMAIAGTGLGALGLVVGIIGIVIVFQAAAQFSADMDRLTGTGSSNTQAPYVGAPAAPERPAATGYTYQVTGNYRATMIGYTASNGDSLMVNNNGTTSSGAKLPWSMNVKPEPNGNMQSLNASTLSAKGDSWITCTIKDNTGAVVASNTGKGAYAGCYASTPLH